MNTRVNRSADFGTDTSAEPHRKRRSYRFYFVAAATLVFLVSMAATATAEESQYHILSAQNLCNLAWPSSQAMPDPAKPVGTLCIRHGGVIERVANAAPNLFSNRLALEPGSVLQLPLGSVRINPADPMSDWLIPDCHVPNRLDCTP
jgi:hypothetical protein